jgi:radical SAM protein with 4Fe4S-binding SPASM domain
MIVRYEPWGAWVKLESTAAIAAVDREGMRSLGLDGGKRWQDDPRGEGRRSAPIEVHLAVTSRCGAGCKGCYLDARPDGDEPPRESLEAVLDAMRDAGVFTVAFGGGEPTTRDDLAELAGAARARGITPVVTTSGLGLTDARLERLRAFEQVNVSYDGSGDTYERVRGFDGAGAAERAIERLAAAGVRVGVNVVLTRESFRRLRETLERARALGACEAQLLRYKPAGRAASLDYLAQRLTAAQGRAFAGVLRELSQSLSSDAPFRLRIDCALVPFLSVDGDIARDPARLARFGVFGCEAAGALAAVTATGHVAPCSFARATDLRGTDLAEGHAHDEDLARWRAWVDAPPEPCASCPIRAVCKGGCKVVTSFVEGAHGPDPECPRVLDARRASS